MSSLEGATAGISILAPLPLAGEGVQAEPVVLEGLCFLKGTEGLCFLKLSLKEGRGLGPTGALGSFQFQERGHLVLRQGKPPEGKWHRTGATCSSKGRSLGFLPPESSGELLWALLMLEAH